MKQFGPFTLDTVNACLLQHGAPVPVRPKPFAVLRYLVENAGRLVSHEELLEALWPGVYVQPQVLRTYVRELRKLLDDDPRNPQFIRSIPKRGYTFVAPVVEGTASGKSKPSELAVGMDQMPLVGRQRELALLREAMHAAASGVPQVVFLTGEPGVGKTAVLNSLRRELDDRFAVAFGQALPGFQSQEYYPIADALRQLHGRISPSFLSDPARLSADISPGDVCAFVEDIARETPLALLVEDLQWADEATLHVLSALARRRSGLPLLIVATVSIGDGLAAEAARSLVYELRVRGFAVELHLPRLGKADLAAVLHAYLRATNLPEELHVRIYDNSEGNPRIALLLVQQLMARGRLRFEASLQEWELRSGLEDLDHTTRGDLAWCMERQFDRLSQCEQHLLECASIPAVAFASWMVAAALGEDLICTEEACERLARRTGFVKRLGEEQLPDGTRCAFYAFARTLHRDILYHRQLPARRALRHSRVAHRLREMFSGREDLIALEAAGHYEAAGDSKQAIAMLRIAMRRALGLRRYNEVAELEARIARLNENGSPVATLHCEARGSPNEAAACDN